MNSLSIPELVQFLVPIMGLTPPFFLAGPIREPLPEGQMEDIRNWMQ